MTELPGKKDRVSDLRELSDPEFFAARQRLREQIELLPPSHPQRVELQIQLDATGTDLERRAAKAWRKAS
jgi:hypothetical protein